MPTVPALARIASALSVGVTPCASGREALPRPAASGAEQQRAAGGSSGGSVMGTARSWAARASARRYQSAAAAGSGRMPRSAESGEHGGVMGAAGGPGTGGAAGLRRAFEEAAGAGDIAERQQRVATPQQGGEQRPGRPAGGAARPLAPPDCIWRRQPAGWGAIGGWLGAGGRLRVPRGAAAGRGPAGRAVPRACGCGAAGVRGRVVAPGRAPAGIGRGAVGGRRRLAARAAMRRPGGKSGRRAAGGGATARRRRRSSASANRRRGLPPAAPRPARAAGRQALGLGQLGAAEASAVTTSHWPAVQRRRRVRECRRGQPAPAAAVPPVARQEAPPSALASTSRRRAACRAAGRACGSGASAGASRARRTAAHPGIAARQVERRLRREPLGKQLRQAGQRAALQPRMHHRQMAGEDRARSAPAPAAAGTAPAHPASSAVVSPAAPRRAPGAAARRRW